MRETQKFTMDNGSRVTISEVDQGEYAKDKISIMLEQKDSMVLLVGKNEAWAIGRALMHLGFEPSCREED